MENLTSQLTRTCSVCGIEKPLSAFLQLDPTHGTSYGKICAKCRGMGKTGKPAPVVTTEDERGTTPSGIGIRGKEKLYADLKREQKIHTLKELYKKEEIKKQAASDEKAERLNLKETAEKKHREFYIDPQKQFQLDSKKARANQQITARQETQKLISSHNALEQHRTILQTQDKAQVETIKTIAKEEIQKTTTSFDNLTHAIAPGRSEMQSARIKEFFRWLGGSAPIVKMLQQDLGSHTPDDPSSRRKR